jgi:hypothetical protein
MIEIRKTLPIVVGIYYTHDARKTWRHKDIEENDQGETDVVNLQYYGRSARCINI